jgi:hypothetical protein
LLFESNDGNFSLFIPMSDVESTDMELKMMSKVLIVETTTGKL